MIFGKRSRALPATRRRLALKQGLRLEHLEHRIVFAGLSPVAVNDLYHAVADQPLEIATTGVLANDTDAEADLLTALEFRGPSHGSLTLNPDGSFVYTPDPDFRGMDGFLYQASDGTSLSSLAAVTIHVTDPNSAPQGQLDSYSVPEDGILGIGSTHGLLVSDGELTSELVVVELMVMAVNDARVAMDDEYFTDKNTSLSVAVPGVLANDVDADGDTLTVEVVDAPSHGTLTLAADGSFLYEPDPDYVGADEFSYRAKDGLEGAIARVSIQVRAENERPKAVNDSYRVGGNSEFVVGGADGVLRNDSDPDGDALSAVLFRGPSYGNLTLNSDGSFSYTPNAGFSGIDSFLYRASDGDLQSRLAVVTLRVSGPVQPSQVASLAGPASNVSKENRFSRAQAVDSVMDTLSVENLLTAELDSLLSLV
jgi:VCBS repeat-containing protein